VEGIQWRANDDLTEVSHLVWKGQQFVDLNPSPEPEHIPSRLTTPAKKKSVELSRPESGTQFVVWLGLFSSCFAEYTNKTDYIRHCTIIC